MVVLSLEDAKKESWLASPSPTLPLRERE